MRISDWSSDVCSSDLITPTTAVRPGRHGADQHHNQDNQKNGADAHGALREMAVKLRLSGDCNPTSRPDRSAPPARPARRGQSARHGPWTAGYRHSRSVHGILEGFDADLTGLGHRIIAPSVLHLGGDH